MRDSRTRPPVARRWPAALAGQTAVAVAYYLTAEVGLRFRTEPEHLAVFWPPNGLLVGLLVAAAAGRERVLVGLVAGVTCFVANLAGGNTLAVSLGFTAINVAEPAAVAWGWLRAGAGRPSAARDVFTLYALALGVCGVSAVPGAALVVYGLGAPDYGAVWLAFWLADAMGVVLVAPPVMAWANRDRPPVRPTVLGAAEAMAAMAAVAGMAGLVFARPFGTGPYPLTFTFAQFPLMLWVAFRLGVRGTTLGLVVLSLVAVWATGHGQGPFADPDVPITHRLLVAQLFLGTIGLSVLTLAAAVAERGRAESALRASEERYRQVTETIDEAFWVVAPDLGRVEYVSPAFAAIWGRPCDDLYADPTLTVKAVHPDDLARLAAGWRGPGEPAEREYRIVRPDGSVRWVCSRSFPVAGADGQPVRVVGVSRDVTARKEAELARAALIDDLQRAAAEIKTLRGMIPMCAWCKKIRDDAGYWQELEAYLRRHTAADVTHGMCPECYREQMAAVGVGRDTPRPGG